MNTPIIRAGLLKLLGEKPTALLHGVRFVHLLRTHRHTDPEAALLPVLLRKGDTAVDVGANGADWTYWISHCVGKGGFVYAFEADPYYALATRYAIRLLMLRRTRLFDFGLSDTEEDLPLRLLDSDGLRTFGISHIERKAVPCGSGISMVHLKRLDSLIEEYPRLLTTALIKCDVEGFELFVFRGAEKILDRARPFVILEVGHDREQGYSEADLFNFFQDREYLSFAMVGERTLAPTDHEMKREGARSINRVLVPAEKVDRIRDGIRILEPSMAH